MIYRIAAPADIPALARLRWESRAEAGEVPIESIEEFSRRFEELVHAGISRLAFAMG